MINRIYNVIWQSSTERSLASRDCDYATDIPLDCFVTSLLAMTFKTKINAYPIDEYILQNNGGTRVVASMKVVPKAATTTRGPPKIHH